MTTESGTTSFAVGHLAANPLPTGILGALGVGGYQLLADVAGVGAGRLGSQAFLLVAPDPDPALPQAGTQVALHGKYSLDGNQFNFRGKARMQAKLSHMVTGWKSILLKPVDPFFSKHGAGTEIPIKVTGTKSAPHFGVDF